MERNETHELYCVGGIVVIHRFEDPPDLIKS
jgi:hypothetical protein